MRGHLSVIFHDNFQSFEMVNWPMPASFRQQVIFLLAFITRKLTLNRDENLLFLESIFLFSLCAGYLMERKELCLFCISLTFIWRICPKAELSQ